MDDSSVKNSNAPPTVRIQRVRRNVVADVIATAALALGAIGVRAQTTTSSASNTNQPNSPMTMKPFAFIFRQSPRQLSEADQKRRLEEVRAWAQRQNSAGRKLDPHILTEENQRIGPDGKSRPAPTSEDGPLIAIAFLEARDFAEAVKIAETHPGLRYGVSIEVRAWTPPPAQPPRP